MNKILRFFLIGAGATAVISGVEGIVGAIQLIDPEEEASLGVSRSSWIVTYAVMLAVGLVMVYFGLRRRRPKKGGDRPPGGPS